jgi:hypothetical protein
MPVHQHNDNDQRGFIVTTKSASRAHVGMMVKMIENARKHSRAMDALY